jgi:hypothetical protein
MNTWMLRGRKRREKEQGGSERGRVIGRKK